MFYLVDELGTGERLTGEWRTCPLYIVTRGTGTHFPALDSNWLRRISFIRFLKLYNDFLKVSFPYLYRSFPLVGSSIVFPRRLFFMTCLRAKKGKGFLFHLGYNDPWRISYIVLNFLFFIFPKSFFGKLMVLSEPSKWSRSRRPGEEKCK
jgi:hypothetical protein